MESFGKDSDVREIDRSHELYSEGNKKVNLERKLESAKKIELNEAVFVKSKSHIS